MARFQGSAHLDPDGRVGSTVVAGQLLANGAKARLPASHGGGLVIEANKVVHSACMGSARHRGSVMGWRITPPPQAIPLHGAAAFAFTELVDPALALLSLVAELTHSTCRAEGDGTSEGVEEQRGTCILRARNKRRGVALTPLPSLRVLDQDLAMARLRSARDNQACCSGGHCHCKGMRRRQRVMERERGTGRGR